VANHKEQLDTTSGVRHIASVSASSNEELVSVVLAGGVMVVESLH